MGHGKPVEARTTDSNSISLRLTSILRHSKKPLGCSSRNAKDNTETNSPDTKGDYHPNGTSEAYLRSSSETDEGSKNTGGEDLG